MKRGGGLHHARLDRWPPTKQPRATPGGLIAASVTACHAGRVGPRACAPPLPLAGNLGVHRTSWRIPFPKACMHVLGTGVPSCFGVPRSASSPNTAQSLGCSLTPGLRISFGRVSCIARAASLPGLPTLGFPLLRSACVWVTVVLGLGFQRRPATPGWGVGVRVPLCARSTRTPPLLARVCDVGVCAWVRVSAAPRHCWPGCRGWCPLVCALRLYPATPGWGVRCGCVCFGLGFGCAPHSWLGVSPLCVCLCACSTCTPPLLARVAAWMCVFGLGSRLRPASPGWGVGPCVFVYALCLHPVTSGWGVRRGCVCLGSGFGCALPLLARVLGCVYVRVRVPLAPCHSWLGCAALACVLGLGSRLCPTILGWGVVVCVCVLRLYPASRGWVV